MDFEFDPTRAVSTLSEAEAAHYHALLADLARAAGAFRFDVAPNPCVGAAVVSDGVEIGRGASLCDATSLDVGPHGVVRLGEFAL